MIIQAGIKAPSFCILKGAETKKDRYIFKVLKANVILEEWELPKIKIRECNYTN